MTRLEQLKKKEEAAVQKALAKEKELLEALARLRGDKREVSAEVREEERKQNNKRRYHMGANLDEAGLFELDNPTLKAVITVLGRARQIPDLPKVLASVLEDWLLPEEKAPASTVEEDLEALVSVLGEETLAEEAMRSEAY